MKINYLTAAEENLMNILWRLETAYMRNILEQFEEPKPHQNTVSTFLKILVEKDFLTTEKEGRIFKYSVAVPFSDYKNFMLKNFLQSYFNDSGKDLLKNLIEENLVEIKDLEGYLSFETKGNNISDHSEKENSISDFIEEITTEKKKKKKKKKKKDGKKANNQPS